MTRAKACYLLDLNIVLDFLQRREPWYPAARGLFEAERQERVDLYVSADAISTLFYQGRKSLSVAKSTAMIEILLQRLRIADVTEAVIRRAFRLGLLDLEDAIQAAAALEAGIGVLVTRDARDYKGLTGLQVLAPDIALAALELERPHRPKA
jgi:predicted nucleic acid-binding protein